MSFRLVPVALASLLLLAGALLASPEVDPTWVEILHGEQNNFIPFAG